MTDSLRVWQVHTSKSTGKTYYSNRVTKKTSWAKPHASLICFDSASGVTPGTSRGSQSGAVADGERRVWLAHTSKTTGKTTGRTKSGNQTGTK